MDNITISKKEYFRLRLAELTLTLLEAGGVDNWEWYSDSLNPDGTESFDELEQNLKKEIFENNNKN